MKKFNLFLIIISFFIMFTTTSCAQPKSDYNVSWSKVPEAVSYSVFLEERSVNNGFNLVSDMDYLSPSVSNFIVETTSDTSVVLRLNNDGKFLVVGVVSYNASGFYSAMAVSEIYQKGLVPNKPALIRIIKK